MITRFLLTVLCVLLTAAPASAECAWVLWTQKKEPGWRGWWSGPLWVADSAYPSKEACDNLNVVRWEMGQDGKPKPVAKDPLAGKRGLGTSWTCLPDTVDPRGPKGGGR